MQCAKCGGAMQPVEVAGERLQVCADCEAVWLSARAVLGLRQADPTAHPLLQPSSELDQEPAPKGGDSFPRCPSCGEAMPSYRYRGGLTTVERCRQCDHLLLDRGELGAMLQEWRHGVEMSPEARDFLQGYREASAFKRLLRAENALGLLGLAAVGYCFGLLRRGSRLDWGLHFLDWEMILAAGVVAVIWYLLRRRRTRRERRRAGRALDRVLRQRVPEQSRVSRPRAAPAAGGSRCPWCNAAVASNASRCPACDSDLF